MATPTGPGKIDVFPDDNCGESDNLKVLLYNFDIAGNTLKPEHKAWLDQNVKPLVKRPGATISIRGLASRSGSTQFNKTLSEQRVASAKKHLLTYNVPVKNMTVSAGGETDAMLTGVPDGVEDEHWRAVLLLVEVPLRNINVKFDRVVPHKRNDGFDPTGRNPWLMFPLQDLFREVRILDGEGLTLVSTKPEVVDIINPFNPLTGECKITSNSEIITLQATKPGDAEIHAVNLCGKVRAKLEVSVMRQLTVKVAFHYVSHTDIGTKKRKVGEEAAMLRIVNSIYNPQTNIKFTSIQARSLPLTGDFGKEVNEPTSDWENIVKNRNTNAQFNVFFVKEVEQGPEPTSGTSDGDDSDALATIGPPGDCIFEDEAGVQEAESLAHEAGHILNCRHNAPIRSQQHMLMWDTTDQRGRFIPKVHVLRMRKAVN